MTDGLTRPVAFSGELREPELSVFERRVLERLPLDINQMVLGAPDIVADGGLAAAPVAFVLVVAGGAFLALHTGEQTQQQEHQSSGKHKKANKRSIRLTAKASQNPSTESSLPHSLGDIAAGATVQTLVEMRSALMIQGRLQ